MRVLVVAPHPDDEAIGCGGAIRKHVLDGDTVHVLYLTSGERGCPGIDDLDRAAALREEEAGVCSQVLETQRVTFWRGQDGALEVTEGLYRRFGTLLLDERPDLIYAPHAGESHKDHRIAAALVWQVSSGEFSALRFYEVWTPMQDIAEVLDITAYASAKRSAIRCYRSQAANGFDEAILALNHYRGLMSGRHLMYAEAFRGQP